MAEGPLSQWIGTSYSTMLIGIAAETRQRINVLRLYCISSFSLFQNGYDAGARFDGISAPVVPGPPPGVPPTAAQLAAMAGHNITLTQKKGNFLTGSGEGGYTFW